MSKPEVGKVYKLLGHHRNLLKDDPDVIAITSNLNGSYVAHTLDGHYFATFRNDMISNAGNYKLGDIVDG